MKKIKEEFINKFTKVSNLLKLYKMCLIPNRQKNVAKTSLKHLNFDLYVLDILNFGLYV